MSLTQWVTLVTLIVVVICLVRMSRKASYIFGSASVFLLSIGYIDIEQFIGSYANISVLTLLLILVASSTLERTVYLQKMSQYITEGGRSRAYMKMGLVVASLSSIMNNTAVVASLMRTLSQSRSSVLKNALIPLSYMAIMGGTLTLIGTSTNLIVNGFLEHYGFQGFQFFDFFYVGIVAAGMGLVTILLLRHRFPDARSAQEKVQDYFVEAIVTADSVLIGQSVQAAGLRSLQSFFLVEIIRDSHFISPVHPNETLCPGDRLVFTGIIENLFQLQHIQGLSLLGECGLGNRKNIVEVFVRQSSSMIGKTIKTLDFRANFDAVVVALHHEGQRQRRKIGDIRLHSGDRLILAVGKDFFKQNHLEKHFIILDQQKAPSHLNVFQQRFALFGFLGCIGLAVFQVMSLFQSLLLFILAAVAFKVIDLGEVKRRIAYDLWVIIGSALVISQVVIDVGLHQWIAGPIALWMDAQSTPYVALIIVYLMTLVVTEMMTNNAAAAIVFPIALALSNLLQVSILPFALAIAYAASASFVSPYGYQTNLMVMNSGGYTFRDFAGQGVVVSFVYGTTVLFLIPVFFPF